jgi:hypothetical protein
MFSVTPIKKYWVRDNIEVLKVASELLEYGRGKFKDEHFKAADWGYRLRQGAIRTKTNDKE